MIPLILSGQKAQTTRIPRKPRKNGAKPYRVGEKVQLYYRSRMSDNCKNCIVVDSPACFHTTTGRLPEIDVCCTHTNFFGESVIKEVIHYWNPTSHNNNRGLWKYDGGDEIWHGCTIGFLPDDEKDSWAKLDGFLNGFKQAHEFFYGETGDLNWMFKDLDVIIWDGVQIARRWYEG